jgi:hypothetical protein
MSTVVTEENYQAMLTHLWSLAFLIEKAPLGEMLAAAEHADAVGAFVDPTLYRDKGRALSEDIEMLRALRPVQEAVGRIRQRRAGR